MAELNAPMLPKAVPVRALLSLAEIILTPRKGLDLAAEVSGLILNRADLFTYVLLCGAYFYVPGTQAEYRAFNKLVLV